VQVLRIGKDEGPMEPQNTQNIENSGIMTREKYDGIVNPRRGLRLDLALSLHLSEFPSAYSAVYMYFSKSSRAVEINAYK
jgi:hypothetical protein